MANWAKWQHVPMASINHNAGSNGSRGNTILNTAYTHKGAGSNGWAMRHSAFYASAIDELYIFMDAHGGTIGNITMECTIYNETSGSATLPSTTARATSTACVIPSADDMWVKFTFGTPYTPTVGEVLWFVCYNKSASPTVDYPQIMTGSQVIMSNASLPSNDSYATFNCRTTTDGFNAASTVATSIVGVIKYANGSVVGCPWTTTAASYYSNNTRKRGIVIPALDAPIVVNAITFGATANANGLQLFSGSNGPDSGADYTWNTGSDTNEVTDEQIGIKVIDTPITLAAGTQYRLVVTFASASTSQQVLRIEDYASYSSVFDLFYGSPAICHSTIDDGASGWTDDKSVSPQVCFRIQDGVASSGGGLMIHPGMTGGMA